MAIMNCRIERWAGGVTCTTAGRCTNIVRMGKYAWRSIYDDMLGLPSAFGHPAVRVQSVFTGAIY